MTKFIVAAAIVTQAIFCAGWASAQEPSKPAHKPTVCEHLQVLGPIPVDQEDKATPVALCRDGKRPVLVRSWAQVTFKDENGKAIKVWLVWK